MHRLQISLPEAQYEFLKSEAFVTEQSMAAVLRGILAQVIETRQEEALQNDPLWEVIGAAQEVDAPPDMSQNVDKYLYGEAELAYYTVPQVAETADEYAAD